MTQVSSTEWQTTLQCTSQNVELKVLVGDTQWMVGANAIASPAAGAFEMYPWFNNAAGTLKVFKSVWSPQLNNSRDVIVYLPPSYLENTLKVHSNVLVMHDGNNLFDPKTAFMGNSWLVQNTLNPLIQ